MAKSFLVSPGRAYLVIAGEGTKIVRSNGTLIDTVPEGANNVSITVDTHEIIVMDNSAKIQQLYNGNSGSSGIMTAAEGEDAGSWKIEIVSTLPEVGSPGVIYMVRTTRTGTDRYDDYIWIAADNAYELLGRLPKTSTVDLSNVAKTNAENTFTRAQRVNSTLYATTVEAHSIDCEALVESANVSAMVVSSDRVFANAIETNELTVMGTLGVSDSSAIRLPGMQWTPEDDKNIFVNRNLDMQTAVVQDRLRVSNVIVLGTSDGDKQITIDASLRNLRIPAPAGNAFIELAPTGITTTNGNSCVMLTEDAISLATSANSDMPVFSISLTGNGTEVKARATGNLIMDGAISILDTLNVHNLNVTGTVTGINTGGGSSPTIDFSNGVTIMNILTAEDIVADTVLATTMEARNSVVVSGSEVVHRATDDGALYITGDIVQASRVSARTLVPSHIQGATFTAPLVVSKDVSLDVWKSGGKASIVNGSLTGFVTADFASCSVLGALEVMGSASISNYLTAKEGSLQKLSVTDRLVVQNLDILGTVTGLPGSGGGEFDLDELSVTSLTVADTLEIANKLVFDSTAAVRMYYDGDNRRPHLVRIDATAAPAELAINRIECTAMHTTSLTAMGNISTSALYTCGIGKSDFTIGDNISVMQPLVGAEVGSAWKYIKIGDLPPGVGVLEQVSPAITLGCLDGSSIAELRVDKICAYHVDQATLDPSSPVFALNTSSVPSLNLQVDTVRIQGRAPMSPIVELQLPSPGSPDSSLIALHGPMLHNVVDRFGSLYKHDGFYIGYADGTSMRSPYVFVSANMSENNSQLRALYSTPDNTYPVTGSAIPNIYMSGILATHAISAGFYPGTKGQLAANRYGAYIQRPMRSLDPTSDILGLYYKPVATTFMPNLWQELVTTEGYPLASVTHWDVSVSQFPMLFDTNINLISGRGYPDSVANWESSEHDYTATVRSFEFGFTTGANGLTVTWPTEFVWPDEPDRIPPTMFQANMCYRFAARVEPVPSPSSRMFDAHATVTYKWVPLISQTYSYPNPWATT